MNKIIKLDRRLKKDAIEENPLIITVRNFSEEDYIKFKSQFSKALSLKQDIIPIIIDSFGGDVYSMLGMISIIENSPVPVATYVETKAMSCGAILFSMGTPGYRFVSPTATMMLHDVSSSSHGKTEEVKVDAKENDRLNNLIFEKLAEKCGYEKKFFLNQIHERGHADWYLTPKEIIKYKLADKIACPNLVVEASVKMRLSF